MPVFKYPLLPAFSLLIQENNRYCLYLKRQMIAVLNINLNTGSGQLKVQRKDLKKAMNKALP